MGFLSKLRDVLDPVGSQVTRKVDKKVKKELGFDPEDPFGWEQKAHDKISDTMGWDFDKFHFRESWDQIKKNPLRIMAPSPISTKVWNEATGRDDDPLVNQLGGPPEQRYQEFVDQGGDVGAAERAGTAHQIAATIASIYAGGALAGAAGGAGGAAAGGGGAAAGTAGGVAAGTTAGTVAGGLTSALPATFSAGLSGTGALATAAINYAATEADAIDREDDELVMSQPSPYGRLNVGNVPTYGYGRARGGLMRAAQPRRHYNAK